MPVVDLGMEPRQDFRYYKIDLEAAEIVSVNYKTGQVSVSVMDRGSQFTKTFESPHPNFSKIAERLTHHVFNLMRFEESAREDVEWRGIKWQNRDSDGESITLSYTYKGIDGTVASSSVPKMVLDTTSYHRVGDLREVLAELETEAKEAWGGKSAQMTGAGKSDGGNGNYAYMTQGIYNGTAVISSISIVSSSGNFDNGTVYIYGSA